MGQNSFDTAAVQSQLGALNGATDSFISTMDTMNTAVSGLSSLKGTTMTNLLNEWDNQYSSVADFKNNFSKWNEVVTLIAAANSDFDVASDATYKDSLANSDSVKKTQDVYASLGMDAAAMTSYLAEYFGQKEQDKDGTITYVRAVEEDGKPKVYIDVKDKNGNLLYSYTNTDENNITYYDANGNILSGQPTIEQSSDESWKVTEPSENSETTQGEQGSANESHDEDYSDYKDGETRDLGDGSTATRHNKSDGTYTIDIEDKDGNKTSIEYNKAGDKTSEHIERSGIITDTKYENGRMSSSHIKYTDDLTAEVEYEYNNDGSFTAHQTISDGTKIDANYNTKGKVISEHKEFPDDTSADVKYNYNDDGSFTTHQTNSDGSSETIYYDNTGNPISTT